MKDDYGYSGPLDIARLVLRMSPDAASLGQAVALGGLEGVDPRVVAKDVARLVERGWVHLSEERDIKASEWLLAYSGGLTSRELESLLAKDLREVNTR